MAPKKRLSLLERQKNLLRESGFSAPDAPKESKVKANRRASGHSEGFTRRQEEALAKSGQGNASSASREAEELVFQDELENDNDELVDTASMGGRSIISHAPSLHPSMAGSVISMACSEVTIGAGDNTG